MWYRSQSNFRSFVSAIRADGGEDCAEDIMGALKVTFFKLSWRSDCSKVSSYTEYKCVPVVTVSVLYRC